MSDEIYEPEPEDVGCSCLRFSYMALTGTCDCGHTLAQHLDSGRCIFDTEDTIKSGADVRPSDLLVSQMDMLHDEALAMEREMNCNLCGRALTDDEFAAATVPIVGGPAGQVCNRCRWVQCPACGADTAAGGLCEACGAPQAWPVPKEIEE